MESTLPQTAATVLINFSLAWIVGVLASAFWLSSGAQVWQAAVSRWLPRAMTVGIVACAVSIFWSLWSESAAMGDVPWLQAWPACAEMMTSTHYGHAGVAALLILGFALVAHWLLVRNGMGRRYLGIMSGFIFLLAAARVTIGHAFEHGPFSVAVWMECLHLLLMSLWVGMVFMAGWVVLPPMLSRESAATTDRAAYLNRMSAWASVALAGIMITGVYNSYRTLAKLENLLGSEYGRILLLKLLLVFAAMALGGFNRFFGLPAALARGVSAKRSSRGLGTVISVLRLESITLFFVLVCAAILTNSAPPGSL